MARRIRDRWAAQLGALEARLVEASASFERLPPDDAAVLWLRWREAFARPVKEQRGAWVIDDFHWHAFVSQIVPALEGNAARAAYASAWLRGLKGQVRREFLVLPFEEEDLAYKARGPKPLELGRKDALVVPSDFSWTMAFTHEDGWFGPYFSDAAWQHTSAEVRSWQAPRRVRRR